MSQKAFSVQLEEWLNSKNPKTLMSLSDVFAEKAFAITFLILMSFPALPIPTGGITHVFEAIAMLVALELIIGRKTIWLPKRWQKIKLGPKVQGKVIPFLIRRVRWFEKYSRPRLRGLLDHTLFRSFIGVLVLILCIAAFFSPPFSGLDTLPAIGVVLISLGLILGDILILIGGIVMGSAGVGISIGFGKIITVFLGHLFSRIF